MDIGEPPHTILLLITLAVLFLFSMFFSSAETAFLSLNKLKLRFLREQNNRAAARAEKVLQNKQKFLSTILIGNSIVNIAISVVVTAAALRIFGDAGLGIAVAAATVLLLIFGEILPKSIALIYPDKLSLVFARFILMLMVLLSPAVRLFSAVTGVLLRLCGIHEARSTAAVTEEDLRDFFQAREEDGFIGSDERILLTNILRYGDFSVRSVMTPRRDIIAIHSSASAAEIIALSQKSHFSRFPVYDSSIDSIQGFFYIKDFLFSSEYMDGKVDFQLSTYLRKPLFVFETSKLAQVEQKFHSEQQTMAIVLDEYGGTAGLITVEDISEEIFGSILDEYDVQEPMPQTNAALPGSDAGENSIAEEQDMAVAMQQAGCVPRTLQAAAVTNSLQVGDFTAEPQTSSNNTLPVRYSAVGSHTAACVPAISEGSPRGTTGYPASMAAVPEGISLIAGNTRLADLQEQLGISLKSAYSDTIGGYIMEKTGEIPVAGCSITVEPYTFTVVAAAANRITQVAVQVHAES
jgi:CBS domain protein